MNTIVTDFPPITTYDLCDPTGVKESEFQEIAIRVLGRLHPDWHIFLFHPNVRHDGAVWQPDLAVVDKERGFWFVIEVEIATHHLEKHVLPQVTAFSQGEYGEDAARQLSNGLNIPVEQTKTLLSIIPREVAVVSNCKDPLWDEKLAAIGVQHLVIETFRNKTTAQPVHRIDGELVPAQRCLGFGTVRANVIITMPITMPGSLWQNGSYDMVGPAGKAKWTCLIQDGRAWLMKERGIIEFHDGAVVQFLRRMDGTILIDLPYHRFS